MDFPKNKFNGWIIPANTVFPDKSIIPPDSQLGDGCKLGDWRLKSSSAFPM